MKPLSYFEKHIDKIINNTKYGFDDCGLFNYGYILDTQYKIYTTMIKQNKKFTVDKYLNKHFVRLFGL